MAHVPGYYVAIKQISFMRGGKKFWAKPGEAIPEAESWPNPKAWEQTGHIRWIPGNRPDSVIVANTPDDKPAAASMAQAEPDALPPNEPNRTISELRLMKKADLLNLAMSWDIVCDDAITKIDLIDMIMTKQEQA